MIIATVQIKIVLTKMSIHAKIVLKKNKSTSTNLIKKKHHNLQEDLKKSLVPNQNPFIIALIKNIN